MARFSPKQKQFGKAHNLASRDAAVSSTATSPSGTGLGQEQKRRGVGLQSSYPRARGDGRTAAALPRHSALTEAAQIWVWVPAAHLHPTLL